MRERRGRAPLGAAAVAAVALAGLLGAGAGAGGQPRAAPTAADLAGIPARDQALTIASQGWQRLTRRPVASLRPLGGAHPGAKSIRVSKDRAAFVDRRGRQRFPYPLGTAIVKTGTRDGALGLVATMRKVRAGSAVSSWRFVEYVRDRSARASRRSAAGSRSAAAATSRPPRSRRATRSSIACDSPTG